MADSDKPSGKVVDVPGMAVVVVPTEVADKIEELISQELEHADDTSGYMFRGVGQIGSIGGVLSEAQATPTGAASATYCHLAQSDDTMHPDADTVEPGV
jgi:hypothetical protein